MTLRIEKLNREHRLDDFACGKEALNRFLIRFAWSSQRAGASQTYLACSDDSIAGYYTLVVGSVEYSDAPERLSKGMPRHPIPLMLLARLAVHTDCQGRGLGAGLLKDALLRTLQAADIAGIRALAVHAKDDDARAFYGRYDFIPSPTDPYHLFLLVKTIRGMVIDR